MNLKPVKLANACELAPDDGAEKEEIRRFKASKTFGEFFRWYEQHKLEPILAAHPFPNSDKFLRTLLRCYEPWPDWVLRVATEVLHVKFPTIDKQTTEDCLRWVHFIFFELRVDGSTSRDEFPPAPKLDATVLGAMFGHGVAMLEHERRKLETILADPTLSPEFRAKVETCASIEQMQKDMAPHLTEYIKARPSGWVGFCTGLAKAKANTFDKSGLPRETTLTRIYEAILSDWPEIEELSGPTALCDFLSQLLKGSENDPEKRLDRVKKICSRMGIIFKPHVKGQSTPPGLSLPINV